jgi:translation elongation factor EF-Ts
MVNPHTIMALRKATGCDLVACKQALDACDDKEGIAYEYLRLKSSAVKRQKNVRGKWVDWSENDYVNEANRLYAERVR